MNTGLTMGPREGSAGRQAEGVVLASRVPPLAIEASAVVGHYCKAISLQLRKSIVELLPVVQTIYVAEQPVRITCT